MGLEDLKRELLRRLMRDLSTCAKKEIDARWGDSERSAVSGVIEKAEKRGVGWDEIVPKTHNPFFYLAQKCWFDNKPGDPRFLWAPYHRDQLCGRAFSYLTAPKVDVCGEVFEGPRDTFKSTFTHGVIPMGMMLRDKHLFGKDSRIILRHHKEQMASANLKRLKAKFLYHPWVRDVWGPACPEYGDKQWGTATEFTLPWVEPGYLAEAQARAIGLTASDTGFHSDYDFGDDLVTEEHMASKKIRDDARLRYEAKQFTRDTLEGREFNTGTRYHINDLWKWMEEAEIDGVPMYGITKVKAISDDDVLAMPYRLTREFLEKRLNEIKARYGTDVLWYLQYQNDPRTSGLTIAHESWFKYVPKREVSGNAWYVILVDCAWKGTKNAGTGDSAAIEVWALERRGSLILRTLMDGVYSNEFTALDGTKQIFRLMQKWNTIDVAPEEHGGYAFSSMLEAEATSRGRMINIIELASRQVAKQMRISTFLKEMQAGRVFVAQECDAEVKKAFHDQVLDFPQCIDDECDALDAAAYSMDPEVVESYAPEFPARRPTGTWDAPSERRTRYCSL